MPYFDHNATTPLAESAREAWLRVQAENWHNPSSPTRPGARARIRLDSYHEALSILLGGAPDEYVFNSGATEGAHAVLAYWAAKLPPAARIAVAATEHACVLAAAGKFFGGRIDWLAHDAGGVVRPEAVRAALAAGAAGVVAMAANNETGVLQPWPEIAELCRAANGGAGVPYLCDATQWLGKLPGAGLGAGTTTWLIASGHKFGAPKGVGFVKLPAGKAEPDFCSQGGGLQERGHRAGTEDVAGAAALCAALGECERVHVIWEWQREEWRKAFERELVATLPGARIVAADTGAGGAGTERLWNTVFAVMPHGEHSRWIARLDKRDIQVSTGAACTTGKDGPSHVLAALGVTPEEARRALRFSSGWSTTEADWATLLAALREIAPGVAS